MFSLTVTGCRSTTHDWSTWSIIEVAIVDAGGACQIWPQSDSTDLASETVAFTILIVLIVLAVLIVLLDMPKVASSSSSAPSKPKAGAKTAETLTEPLLFPGKLVDGKYDVQHLQLLVLLASLTP